MWRWLKFKSLTDKKKLVGIIPNKIGALKLQNLSLMMNKIQGTIHHSIQNFGYNITEISLYENKLEGTIPYFFDQLPDLEILNLGLNQISGTIPKTLNNHKWLRILELFYNNLHGSIYLAFETLTSLEFLQVHSNDLTGTITDGIANFSGVLLILGKMVYLELYQSHLVIFLGL